MTDMVAKLDDVGKPIWVALLVLSFVVFWPIGLALLAFLLTSGRLGSRHNHWCAASSRRRHWARPSWQGHSGNTAFDEYREQTLQRLEEEQQEFHDFLKQLRRAKDRTEFDRFMANRAARADEDDEPQPGPEDAEDERPSGGSLPPGA
ncbi:MAG: DUF2852 domain-containing protein [Myxococcota bacterium]